MNFPNKIRAQDQFQFDELEEDGKDMGQSKDCRRNSDITVPSKTNASIYSLILHYYFLSQVHRQSQLLNELYMS